MSSIKAPPLAALALAGLSFGCASLPELSGFQQVQETVHERTGFTVEWNRQVSEEEAARDKVRSLLQKELTAEDAVAIALVNSHRLQATLEELGIARAEQVLAVVANNPVFSTEVRFPGRPFEITVVQSLLRLIQRPKRHRLGAAAFEAARHRITNDVLEMVAEARAAFHVFQAAEQMTAMRRTVAEAARASAELALRLREAGNLSDLNLENEQAMFAQAKLDLARSETDVLATRERLNALMGLWGAETNWKAAPGLPELPPEELDLKGLESFAISQRLDLKAARQEVEVAARSVPLARAEAIGDLFAGVHLEREPEGTRTTGPEIVVPLPLLNSGRAARSRAEAVLRQAWQRYAALAVEARSEVRSARDRMLAARSQVEYYRNVVLPRLRRIVALSQRHYNFMLLGPFELLLAKRNEITAEREHIEALREYWVARSDLQRALGGSLPAGEPVALSSDPAEAAIDHEESKEPSSYHQRGDQ